MQAPHLHDGATNNYCYHDCDGARAPDANAMLQADAPADAGTAPSEHEDAESEAEDNVVVMTSPSAAAQGIDLPRTSDMPEWKQPTEQEYEDHMATHYRRAAWCRHCIAGAGKDDAHRKRGNDEEGGFASNHDTISTLTS